MFAQELPIVSDGALTLLAIVLEKDKQKQFTRNRALELSLDYMARLPLSCREGSGKVAELVGVSMLPKTLFRFCAEFLNSIERNINRRDKTTGQMNVDHSDYDHAVLFAVGQAITRSSGITPSLGPELPVALERLGKKAPIELHRLLLRNYFGNVLQETFDSCDVRRSVPDLAEDVELNLRLVDAKAIADWLLVACQASVNGIEFKKLTIELGELMAALFVREARRR
jgi:hypothetical protein